MGNGEEKENNERYQQTKFFPMEKSSKHFRDESSITEHDISRYKTRSKDTSANSNLTNKKKNGKFQKMKLPKHKAESSNPTKKKKLSNSNQMKLLESTLKTSKWSTSKS